MRVALTFDTEFPGGASAPRIHVWSTFLDFLYDAGGYSLDPLRQIPVEVPAHRPLEFHLEATASPGRVVVGSRWMLDGDVFDETRQVSLRLVDVYLGGLHSELSLV